MAGGRIRGGDAQDQLLVQDDPDGEASCSTSYSYPRFELPLPGTMQSTDGLAPPPAFREHASNGNPIARDRCPTSSKAAVQAGPSSPAANGVTMTMTPGPAAAAEPPASPRPPMPTSAGGSSSMAVMEIQEALLQPQPSPAFQHPISLARRRWMVFMFCLVAALLFADQNLLAPNMTAAAAYFRLDERQKDTLLGGALMAAFFAVGAPAALLVGWLTDRGDINRRTLLFWVVLVGETPCLLTYWVTSYWQFFLLRALTGVAVGGCFPLVFSLLGDLYPPGRRAAVSAVVQIATGVGLAAGQALSGSIGPATNWRLPFVVVAAPSLAVAALLQLSTEEPPRGAFEEALRERYAEGGGPYEGSISWPKLRALLRTPSNVLIIAQGVPGSLPWGMVLTYFNDFLAQQKGFSVQAATGVLLLFGAGGAVGVIGGGAGGQWLYNRRKEYQALLAGGCVLAGIAPLYVLINADLQRLGLAATCLLAALGGAVSSVAGPNLRAVMLNVNAPETRGVALALQSMTDDLGKGLGPVLVAGLIHALGRPGAFNVATAGWVPCGVMLAALAACMRRDEAAMQARLAASSEALQQAAEAEAAAAGGDAAAAGSRNGVTVVLPPPSPPSRSDGGGGAAVMSAEMPSPPAAAAAAAAALRKEERRLARLPLLAGGGGSSTSDNHHQHIEHPHEHPDGYPGTAPLPLSSSAGEPEVEAEAPGCRGRREAPAAGNRSNSFGAVPPAGTLPQASRPSSASAQSPRPPARVAAASTLTPITTTSASGVRPQGRVAAAREAAVVASASATSAPLQLPPPLDATSLPHPPPAHGYGQPPRPRSHTHTHPAAQSAGLGASPSLPARIGLDPSRGSAGAAEPGSDCSDCSDQRAGAGAGAGAGAATDMAGDDEASGNEGGRATADEVPGASAPPGWPSEPPAAAGADTSVEQLGDIAASKAGEWRAGRPLGLAGPGGGGGAAAGAGLEAPASATGAGAWEEPACELGGRGAVWAGDSEAGQSAQGSEWQPDRHGGLGGGSAAVGSGLAVSSRFQDQPPLQPTVGTALQLQQQQLGNGLM